MSATKYVLIERPEHHPTAVSPAVYRDMLESGEQVDTCRPVTLTEIRKSRIHIYEDGDYWRHKEWDTFRTKYHGKELPARVVWFDKLTGVGSVEFDGKLATIWACNITGKKTWYPETACTYYERGQEIRVRIETSFGGRIDVIGVTPGHLDHERWEQLKDKDLAFRCDDAGNAVTGLFAETSNE